MKRPGEPGLKDRISQLLEARGLRQGAAAPIESLLGSLSEEHAPTAVKDPEEGLNIHVADSLSAFDLPVLPECRVIADIGSGCGVPGLVIAATLPTASVTAVESIGRKCDFIRSSAEAAGLANVQVVNCRAEEWSDGIGSCDAVLARALAPLPVLAEYAAPLLRDGGVLVAWKGSPSADEVEAGSVAAAKLGLEVASPITVEPWPGSGGRKLFVMRKVAPTPAGYPRRAGMASKRPLA